MSEMIERVLKAIQREDDPISDGSHSQTFSQPNAREDRQRRMARAAIEAMREPTEGMREAGADAIWRCFSDDMQWGSESAYGVVDEVFSVMMMAALSTPKERT